MGHADENVSVLNLSKGPFSIKFCFWLGLFANINLLCPNMVVIAENVTAATEVFVDIVSRSEWGARNPTSNVKLDLPVSYVFIHHTAGRTSSDFESEKQLVRGVQNFHMDTRKWDDIGYSFLVGGDGKIFEGRGWFNVGAHTLNYNSQGYGIAFLGTFTESLPTLAALNATKNIIAYGVQQGKLKQNYILKGHRQVRNTECPGEELYRTIQTWPNYAE